MNPFLLLSVGAVIGIFTISQSFVHADIFDFYFYLLPFGMALIGLFVSAGLLTHFPRSISAGLARALPLCGAAAILVCVALYVYGGVLGTSMFFLALVIVQLLAYMSLWLAVARGGRPVLPATGFMAGVTLGYALTAYRHMDPLVVELRVAVFCAALYFALFLKQKLQTVVYVLLVSFFALAVYQPGKHTLMPETPGWLDYGKAGVTEAGDWGKRIWGPAGLTLLRSLSPDSRDAWLYTNGAAPSLVPLSDPSGYDDAWWAQKAPLVLALFDATAPGSVVDIGAVPSEMAWRAVGQGVRDVYGLYASGDWSLLRIPGLDWIRSKVVPLQHPVQSAMGQIKLPVDMIVLSSGHEGKEGWTSSIAGEQAFLNQENILRYWRTLSEDGVLILLSRQQPIFFKQIFSVQSALKRAGMSDAEFLDHAWGVVPDTEMADSPYRYALVLTKKARDERFARAIRGQVIHLPVKYLFGYAIPPSRPYDYFYQDGFDKIQTLFTQGVSGMLGKQMNLEGPSVRRAVPYQLVEDVYPPYKNFLVLSVGIFIGIVLFPLQKYRRIEYLQTLQAPGVAVWMVAGGAAGSLMALALAFLVVYPSSILQEYRLLYLVMLILIATLVCQLKVLTTITTRTDLLLGLAFVLGLVVFLVSLFTQMIGKSGEFLEAGFAGILFVLLGASMFTMPSVLPRESQVPLLGWWWFAVASGCALTLFWSMRLYATLGNDGLFLVASVLLILVAAIFGWGRRLHGVGTHEPDTAKQDPVFLSPSSRGTAAHCSVTFTTCVQVQPARVGVSDGDRC